MIGLIGVGLLIISGAGWLLATLLGPWLALLGGFGTLLTQVHDNMFILFPVSLFLIIWGGKRNIIIALAVSIAVMLFLKFYLGWI